VDINKGIESLWTMMKPQVASIIRGGMKAVAGSVATWGAFKAPGSEDQFVDIGTAIALAGSAQGWSWWQISGHEFVEAKWQVMVAKTLAQAQVIRTAKLPPVTVKEIAAQSPTMDVAAVTKAIGTLPPAVQANIAGMTGSGVKGALAVLAILFLGLAWPGDASAQFKTPAQIEKDVKNFNAQTAAKAKAAAGNVNAAVTGQPAPPSTAAVTCDFTMFIHLTPFNLVPTIKECTSDAAGIFAADTQRALDAAIAGSDNDAVNCLKPGLAIIKAGIIIPAVQAVAAQPAIPAVPAQAAIPETSTSPAIPAVPAQAAVPAVAAVAGSPEQDPGPVYLYEEYRLFTIAGGLTSCQTWINGPVQATIAAGAGAVAGVAGAAAAGAALVP
jgi:hypothetical protein